MKILKIPLLLITAFLLLASGSCNSGKVRRIDDGIIVRTAGSDGASSYTVRLKIINDRIIRVSAVPGDRFPDIPSLMAVSNDGAPLPEFTVVKEDGSVTISTSFMEAQVSLLTGEVKFTDSAGNLFLEEKHGGGKDFVPATGGNEEFYSVRQQFESAAGEPLYGLGANQTSFMNMKSRDADLFQYNTQAVVPFMISGKNYGILWDNNSRSKFGDTREWQPLSSLRLFDSNGEEGALTATYTKKKDHSAVFTVRRESEIDYQFIPDLVKFPEGYDLSTGSVTWEGSFSSDTGGIHKFDFTSAGYARLWIDGKLIFDRWRQAWNTSSNFFFLEMTPGKRYPVKIEWIPDGGESFIAFRHLDPADPAERQRISFWSEVAGQIDYYFIAGTSMDDVISGYRTITGKAPVMPKWAMGFWQSRERYTTSDELLGVVSEYRKRQIPLDNIVLDWQYWPVDKWGDHDFDSTRFPDPDGMIDLLHNDLNAHIMISVWPKYYVGTGNYEMMKERGWLYMRNIDKGQKDWLGYVSTFYDAFNAEARISFWDQINGKLYSKGIDAWWLDATEPDICSNLPMAERKALMDPTALGPADQYFNAYSLEQARSVFEGQMRSNPGSRVFILTRSAFAGLQRYSAANWSGDIASRWHDMAAQIPCGLNFCMSGIPFWTMDIGGFAVESRYYNPTPADLDEWRELMTRWYQFGAFVPLFRAHGQYPYREIFNVAPSDHPAYKSIVEYDRLRYRLLPYIYSLNGMTWLNDYTIMRGLVMDFPSDTALFDIGNQYMFGPALMVCPVTEYKARSRAVYLPSSTGWYSLADRKHFDGGQHITASAPYTSMPLFVRDGAIIPAGPALQYSSEKQADTITLFVFTGADGHFTLYEDEGSDLSYASGAYSLIGIDFNEAGRQITIRARSGEYPGMPVDRVFNVIVVSPDGNISFDFEADPTAVVNYTGEEVTVKL